MLTTLNHTFVCMLMHDTCLRQQGLAPVLLLCIMMIMTGINNNNNKSEVVDDDKILVTQSPIYSLSMRTTSRDRRRCDWEGEKRLPSRHYTRNTSSLVLRKKNQQREKLCINMWVCCCYSSREKKKKR